MRSFPIPDEAIEEAARQVAGGDRAFEAALVAKARNPPPGAHTTVEIEVLLPELGELHESGG